MEYDEERTIAFYTVNREGLYDELIVHIREKHYEYNRNLAEKDLWKEGQKKKREFLVENDLFDAYHQALDGEYNATHFFQEKPYEERQEERRAEELKRKKKPKISKEKIWQAIRFELEEDELLRISSYDYEYEKDDYYDFAQIMKNLRVVMRGDKTVSYFTTWCIVMMRCLMEYRNFRAKKLSALYYDLGDYFDAVAFIDDSLSVEEKRREFREILARLKYHGHRIDDCKNKKETDFTTNGVITYVSFGFSLDEGGECVYRVCIVDEEKEVIRYMYVEEFEYLEEINYTFLDDYEFDDLPSAYWNGYRLDNSLPLDYAIKKKL